MFDDNQQTAGQVPNNLPTGEPEDILAGTDEASAVSLAGDDSIPTTEPPVSAQPSALTSGVLKPKNKPTNTSETSQPVAPPTSSLSTEQIQSTDVTPVNNMVSPTSQQSLTPPTPVVQPTPIQPNPTQITQPIDVQDPIQPTSDLNASMSVQPTTIAPTGEMNDGNYILKEPIGSRKTIMWIVIIVIVVVLGAGSLWIYFSFIRDGGKSGDGFDLPSTETVTDFETTQPTKSVLPEQEGSDIVDNLVEDTGGTEINLEDSILFGEPIDTDGDGLDDVREADLNTDPLNWDTDGDGLADGHEVVIWKTDPLNSDTDGDGYKDGEEIDNGYSPTGPGKLFQPPTTTEE